MRAIEITRFGEPEVLQPATRPDPQPGPGELLVRVKVLETDEKGRVKLSMKALIDRDQQPAYHD